MPHVMPELPTLAAPSLDAFDTEVFPHFPDAIPPGVLDAGRYRLRFAWTRADLHAVQRLRFAVFNEELGEGLAASATTGLDADERDPSFHHLLIEDRTTGSVVGTYRVQTALMAATRHGFYGATLFELATVPSRILAEAVEIGRACVAPAHRNGRVLRLLWRGLARYLQWNGKRYLFGCCSLPGTDHALAHDTWRTLHVREALHPDILVRPRPHTRALPDNGRTAPTPTTAAPAPLPALFEGYLSLGARVCGPPAIDRDFGTTDCLVLLDIHALDQRTFHSFFA
jgi:putative hemolysin